MSGYRVRDLEPADLPHIAWSGGPLHPRHVAAALDRRASGEVDYLAVCDGNDLPVAIGGVDYAVAAGAGTVKQLAVRSELQSKGLGTMLIAAAEVRIRGRGLAVAELSVADDNLRARALYERLGYRPFGTEVDRWEDQGPDGRLVIREAHCVRMRKQLEGTP